MENKSDLKNTILKIIYLIIDEHNNSNSEDLNIQKSLNTELIGSQGKLDSLGFLNLIVNIESKVREEIHSDITVIDETLFLKENGPYKNINSLVEYILSQIK